MSLRITSEGIRPMRNTRDTARPLEQWEVVEGCLLAQNGRYLGIIREGEAVVGGVVRTPYTWYVLMRPRNA